MSQLEEDDEGVELPDDGLMLRRYDDFIAELSRFPWTLFLRLPNVGGIKLNQYRPTKDVQIDEIM